MLGGSASRNGELVNSPLGLYRLIVRLVLKIDGRNRIANDSDCHAVVLTTELINHARKKVDVFCRELSDSVWGTDDVIGAIRAALARGIRFHVLVQKSIEECGNARAYRLFSENGVPVRHYRKQTNDADPAAPMVNFMIVDDKAFRFEPDSAVHKGFAYARNEELAKQISETFGRIWKASDAKVG